MDTKGQEYWNLLKVHLEVVEMEVRLINRIEDTITKLSNKLLLNFHKIETWCQDLKILLINLDYKIMDINLRVVQIMDQLDYQM